jgi:signal peptidase II
LRDRFLFIFILAAAVACDLISKWAVFKFVRAGEAIPVIPGVVQFRPVFNPGAVFGVLPGVSLLFVVISLGATAAIIWILLSKQGKSLLTQSSLALILAGILGNLYDRLNFIDPRWSSHFSGFFDCLKHGAVRDFIDFYGIWPCFNAADTFICIGVGLALLQFLLLGKGDKESVPEETAGVSPTRKV